MSSNRLLYDQIISISEHYLGPVCERFMRRQIETHLNIAPEKITPKDLPTLVEWTRLAFAMVTNNSEQLESFARELLELSHTNNSQSAYAKKR